MEFVHPGEKAGEVDVGSEGEIGAVADGAPEGLRDAQGCSRVGLIRSDSTL